jgi:hypothetical protein
VSVHLVEATPGFVAAVIADLFNDHADAMVAPEIRVRSAELLEVSRNWQSGVTVLTLGDRRGSRTYKVSVEEVGEYARAAPAATAHQEALTALAETERSGT